MHVVTAVGTYQQQGPACHLQGQGMQKLQASLVAPMHVLYDQQQRTLLCLPREEVCQGGKEAALLLLGGSSGNGGRLASAGSEETRSGSRGARARAKGPTAAMIEAGEREAKQECRRSRRGA